MKSRIFIFLSFLLFFIFIIFYAAYNNKVKDGSFVYAFIGDNKVYLEVAKSDEKKIKGLSDRYFLEKDNGMIFIFDDVGKYTFWNKNTYIPLDLLWVRGGKIVYFVENMKIYDGYSPVYYIPKEEADMVIELNAGFIKNNNINIGDKVKIIK